MLISCVENSGGSATSDASRATHSSSAAGSAQSSSRSEFGPGSTARRRVLIADDHPINLDVATRILQSLGCQVVAAEGGAAALERFAQDMFDIVLMDCEMPGMDGVEATRQARRAEAARSGGVDEQASRRVPIIALTAHSADEFRDKCVAAGMDDFITKPLTKKKLQDVLCRWLPEPSAAPVCRDREAAEPDGAASLGQGPVIDKGMLSSLMNARAGDAANFLARLIHRFEQLASGHVAQLWQENREGRSDEVRRIAHRLKSSAGAIGACRLASRAGQIERQAKEHGLAGLEPVLEQLNNDLSAALEGLRTFAGECDGTAAR